jgi:hypothetical protein
MGVIGYSNIAISARVLIGDGVDRERRRADLHVDGDRSSGVECAEENQRQERQNDCEFDRGNSPRRGDETPTKAGGHCHDP